MPILYPPSLIACKRRLKDGPLDALLLNSGEPGKESREPKVVYKLSASVGNGVTLKDLKGQLRLFLLDLEFFGGGAIDNVEAEMTEEALLKVLNLKPNSPSTSDEHVTSDARKQGGQVEKHPYLSLGESEKNLRLYIEDDPTLWEMHDEFIDSGMSGPNGFYWDFFLPLTPEAEQEDFLDGKSWSNVFAYMDQDDEEEVEGKATPVNLDNDEVEPDGGDTTGNAHPVARTAQTKRTFTSSELRKSHVLSARGVSSLLYSHTQPPRAEDLWIPSFSLGSLFDQIDARDEAEWLSSD